MKGVEFSRLFAMSAFEGLRALRLQRLANPELGLVDLAEFLRRVDPEGSSHDYDAAFQLDAMVVQSALAHDPEAFYQQCIEAAITGFRPLWGRIITLGRRKFVQKLSRDEVQCFRSAGLLEDPPTNGIVTWWDRVAAAVRLRADQEKMIRARDAEQMSLAHETRRLAELGINIRPVWMSIEDNTAGYDIQSYDVGVEGPVARLIEVKSTIASPLRFRLTRHEWETAKKYGPAYFFHVWDLQGPRLHEKTVADILPHVPTDNERGRWENAEIPVIQS
ncbi:MAG: DUF3883 domain-containing protein [Candidatus Binataceae bacterium]